MLSKKDPNTDPDTVVMGRRMFSRLMYLATGASVNDVDPSQLAAIRKHLSKFNVELDKEYAEIRRRRNHARAMARRDVMERKAVAKAFFQECVDKLGEVSILPGEPRYSEMVRARGLAEDFGGPLDRYIDRRPIPATIRHLVKGHDGVRDHFLIRELVSGKTRIVSRERLMLTVPSGPTE